MDRRQFLKTVYKTAGIAGLCGIGLSLREAKCFADTNPYINGIPSAQTGSDCPGGTETFFWNGDHSSGTTIACNNAEGEETGTQSGGTISTDYGQTGYGFRKTANDQYITWSVAGGDLLSGVTGTVWESVNVTNDGSRTTDVVFESFLDASNKLKLTILATNAIRMEATSGGVISNLNSDDTLTTGIYQRVGYSWNQPTGVIAVKVNAGSWKEKTGQTMTTWSPNDVTIGENATGGGETDTIDIDNVSVFPAYQQADPGV